MTSQDNLIDYQVLCHPLSFLIDSPSSMYKCMYVRRRRPTTNFPHHTEVKASSRDAGKIGAAENDQVLNLKRRRKKAHKKTNKLRKKYGVIRIWRKSEQRE